MEKEYRRLNTEIRHIVKAKDKWFNEKCVEIERTRNTDKAKVCTTESKNKQDKSCT